MSYSEVLLTVLLIISTTSFVRDTYVLYEQWKIRRDIRRKINND